MLNSIIIHLLCCWEIIWKWHWNMLLHRKWNKLIFLQLILIKTVCHLLSFLSTLEGWLDFLKTSPANLSLHSTQALICNISWEVFIIILLFSYMLIKAVIPTQITIIINFIFFFFTLIWLLLFTFCLKICLLTCFMDRLQIQGFRICFLLFCNCFLTVVYFRWITTCKKIWNKAQKISPWVYTLSLFFF